MNIDNEGGLQNDGTLSEFEKEPVFEKFVTDKESNPTSKIHKYLGKGGFGVIRYYLYFLDLRVNTFLLRLIKITLFNLKFENYLNFKVNSF